MKHRPTPMPSPYWSEPETTLHVEGAIVLGIICLLVSIVQWWPS